MGADRGRWSWLVERRSMSALACASGSWPRWVLARHCDDGQCRRDARGPWLARDRPSAGPTRCCCVTGRCGVGLLGEAFLPMLAPTGRAAGDRRAQQTTGARWSGRASARMRASFRRSVPPAGQGAARARTLLLLRRRNPAPRRRSGPGGIPPVQVAGWTRASPLRDRLAPGGAALCSAPPAGVQFRCRSGDAP